MMYNDFYDVVMYPLQMVLPLISQQNSTTIGNNGSSRGQPPHYQSHGSASSQLTTLSQYLPDELLNCIQPTLNHLANSLANAPKETKVAASGVGGMGQGCASAPASHCSGAGVPPPPTMSVFPPLVKPQRGRQSTGSTPRKTWQSCSSVEASPSLINSAEYPQLSVVSKCKSSEGNSVRASQGHSERNGCQNSGTQVHSGKSGKKTDLNAAANSGAHSGEKTSLKSSGGDIQEISTQSDEYATGSGKCRSETRGSRNTPNRDYPPPLIFVQDVGLAQAPQQQQDSVCSRDCDSATSVPSHQPTCSSNNGPLVRVPSLLRCATLCSNGPRDNGKNQCNGTIAYSIDQNTAICNAKNPGSTAQTETVAINGGSHCAEVLRIDGHSKAKRAHSPFQTNDQSRCPKCNPAGLFTGLKCICCVVISRSKVDAKYTNGVKPCDAWKPSPLIGGAKIVRKKSTPPNGNSTDPPVPPHTLSNISPVIKQDSQTCTNVNNVNREQTKVCKDVNCRNELVSSVQSALNIIEGTVGPSLSNVHISQPAGSDSKCDMNSSSPAEEEHDSKLNSVQLNCSNSIQNCPKQRDYSCDSSRTVGDDPCVDHGETGPRDNEECNQECVRNGDIHGKMGQYIDGDNYRNVVNYRNNMDNARCDVNYRNEMNKNRNNVRNNMNRNNFNNASNDLNNMRSRVSHKLDLVNVRNELKSNSASDHPGHYERNGNHMNGNADRNHVANARNDINNLRNDMGETSINDNGKSDRDSPNSHSSPSESGHSNKENYSSKYNNNRNLNNHYYNNNNNGYHYNGYNRSHGSLHSSRTNSYDDLKSSERYYDSRDFRSSNNKLAENSNTWQNNRNNYNKSRSPVRYNNYGRGYQQQRMRFVENKNYNGNNYNNTRHWVNNNNYYNRGHNNYFNNNQYNNNKNYRNNSNNKSGYNNDKQNQSSGCSNQINCSDGTPNSTTTISQDSTSGVDPTSRTPEIDDRDTPSPTEHSPLTPSAGLRGSSSSLSSCSNTSEGKSLKRHYTSSSTPALNTNRSHNSLPLHRTQDRPLSPYGFHQHYYYVQNKRRNTSNGGSNGPHQGGNFTWGGGANAGPPLLSTPLARPLSQRRPGPDLNFYTPALASLALGQGEQGAPLLTLGPPPLVAAFSGTMLTEVPRHVPEFDSWDLLSKSIWTRFLTSQQTETRFRQKMHVSRAVEEYVRFVMRDPSFRLFVVGSTMSGFGTDTSDVDMCLGIRPYEFDRNLAIRVLYVLESNMNYYLDIFKKAELIHAKVPILKFQDRKFNVEVDLNCNNVVGVRNTHLLYCYAQMDWRIRPLVLLVKLWARAHNINDAKNMTISSYSFTLMVIHFLQCGTSPPVLPNLVAKYPGKFSANSNIESIQIHEKLGPYQSSNEESLGALLTQFFHYYANFEYFEYAISVRRGTKIPIEECRSHKSQRNKFNQWKYLCIEEPFDLTNTARSVYNLEVFEHIRGVIRKCSALLESTQDLNSIFEPLS